MLRWLVKDGKRILQQYAKIEPQAGTKNWGDGFWIDIPLVDEEAYLNSDAEQGEWRDKRDLPKSGTMSTIPRQGWVRITQIWNTAEPPNDGMPWVYVREVLDK